MRYILSLSFLAFATIVPASSDVPASTESAAPFLEFESVIDGKCHNLSEGGKLRVMHNRHPSQAIKYRLIRVFAGKPQAGRAMGVIGPEQSRKIGCTLLDNREQTWVVDRADFTELEADED
jgi:hypothetical protein